MAVIFAEIGQEVHIVGGDFEEAINEGVADGYLKGYLRCSIVADPLTRVNTGNNTPAVIHTRIVKGRITSYNVCYTKLLRFLQTNSSGIFIAFMAF